MTLVKSPLTASRNAKAAPSMPSAGLLAPSASAVSMSVSRLAPDMVAAGISPCAACDICWNVNTLVAARRCSMSMISAVAS